MALCESSNRRMREHLQILPVQAVKLQSTTVKPPRAITRNPGVWTNHFELLMLKHGRAYSAYEFRRKYVCDNEM